MLNTFAPDSSLYMLVHNKLTWLTCAFVLPVVAPHSGRVVLGHHVIVLAFVYMCLYLCLGVSECMSLFVGCSLASVCVPHLLPHHSISVPACAHRQQEE